MLPLDGCFPGRGGGAFTPPGPSPRPPCLSGASALRGFAASALSTPDMKEGAHLLKVSKPSRVSFSSCSNFLRRRGCWGKGVV